MDRLEQFINENRSAFDDKMPSDKVWDGIEKSNRPPKLFKGFNYWRAAAVLFIGLSLGLLVDKFGAVEDTAVAEEAFTDELITTENYYTQLISDKRVEVLGASEGFDQMQRDLLAELSVQDSIYMDLKKDWLKTNDPKVQDALILNLQTRLDILNYQLNLIREIKNNENETVEYL